MRLRYDIQRVDDSEDIAATFSSLEEFHAGGWGIVVGTVAKYSPTISRDPAPIRLTTAGAWLFF